MVRADHGLSLVYRTGGCWGEADPEAKAVALFIDHKDSILEPLGECVACVVRDCVSQS